MSGSQTYGSSTPAFASALTAAASGVDLTGTGTCTRVSSGAAISASLAAGSYTIDPGSCEGLSLAGPNAANYTMSLVGETFIVRQAEVQVLMSGNQTYGSSTPAFGAIPASHYLPSGVLPVSGTDRCSTVDSGTAITQSLAVGTHTIDASSCSGPSLTGPNAANYTLSLVGGTFTVFPAEIRVTVYGAQQLSRAPFAQPSFSAAPTSGSLPSGVTLIGTFTCTTVNSGWAIGWLLDPGTYTIDPGSCTGLRLGGPNAANYTLSLVGGTFRAL